jgi:hypothetical protein
MVWTITVAIWFSEAMNVFQINITKIFGDLHVDLGASVPGMFV